MTRRFAANLARCSSAVFTRMGFAYTDLLPIETSLNRYIDLIKKNEFRELDCARDLEKCAGLTGQERVLMRV